MASGQVDGNRLEGQEVRMVMGRKLDSVEIKEEGLMDTLEEAPKLVEEDVIEMFTEDGNIRAKGVSKTLMRNLVI